MAESVILDFTQNDLDSIVRSGEPVFTFDGGRFSHHDLRFPPVVGDWGLKLIAKNGVGNQGFVVAVPRSGRTRRIFREGKIAELTNRFGDRFSPEHITLYVDKARGIGFVFEPHVVEFVLTHHADLTVEHLYDFKQARHLKKAVEATLGQPVSLSFLRLLSALEMVAKMNGYRV